jgi:hypothetical protein
LVSVALSQKCAARQGLRVTWEKTESNMIMLGFEEQCKMAATTRKLPSLAEVG